MGSEAATAGGDMFAWLPDDVVHPVDAETTRVHTDGRECPLCRAGWCVQQVVPVQGGDVLVLHGLLLH